MFRITSETKRPPVLLGAVFLSYPFASWGCGEEKVQPGVK